MSEEIVPFVEENGTPETPESWTKEQYLSFLDGEAAEMLAEYRQRQQEAIDRGKAVFGEVRTTPADASRIETGTFTADDLSRSSRIEWVAGSRVRFLDESPGERNGISVREVWVDEISSHSMMSEVHEALWGCDAMRWVPESGQSDGELDTEAHP